MLQRYYFYYRKLYSHSTTIEVLVIVNITVFLANLYFFGDNFGVILDNDWLPLKCTRLFGA